MEDLVSLPRQPNAPIAPVNDDIVNSIVRTEADAGFPHPNISKFVASNGAGVPESNELRELYNLKKSAGTASHLPKMLEAVGHICGIRGYILNTEEYRKYVLPELLIRCGVRDCCLSAVCRSPHSLFVPASRDILTKRGTNTDSGEFSNVAVIAPMRGSTVFNTFDLPPGLQYSEQLSIVTKALQPFYEGRRIWNFNLLEHIYGEESSFSNRRINPTLLCVSTRKGASIMLNSAETEAVVRYRSDAPAFAVECPTDSEMHFTMAAMAASYRDQGVQLFLSSTSKPLFGMAEQLAGLYLGGKKICHLLSTDQEVSTSSSFAATDADCDIVVSTVDVALDRLLAEKHSKRRDPMQMLLEYDVTRIVVADAALLSEAALNALILNFPDAKIALFGFTKEEGSIDYSRDDAITVFKRRKNIPVIKLMTVPLADPSVMGQRLDVRNTGPIPSSGVQRLPGNPLAVLHGPLKRTCLFIKSNGKDMRCGASMINDGEIATVERVVWKLRHAGFDHNYVLVLTLYEAEMKLAGGSLPLEYEVQMMDSAKAREKRIVIVLTTSASMPSPSAFEAFKKMVGAAIRRRKTSLVVIGHEQLPDAAPWCELITKKHFQVVSFK